MSKVLQKKTAEIVVGQAYTDHLFVVVEKCWESTNISHICLQRPQEKHRHEIRHIRLTDWVVETSWSESDDAGRDFEFTTEEDAFKKPSELRSQALSLRAEGQEVQLFMGETFGWSSGRDSVSVKIFPLSVLFKQFGIEVVADDNQAEQALVDYSESESITLTQSDSV